MPIFVAGRNTRAQLSLGEADRICRSVATCCYMFHV